MKFKSNLNELTKIEILKLYILYTLFIIIFSTIYAYFFTQVFQYMFEKKSFQIIPGNLPFAFGGLIEEILKNNNYVQYERYENTIIPFHLKKLPFYTFFMVAILKVTQNIFLIFIIKNFITFSFFFLIIFICYRSLNFILLYFILTICFIALLPTNFATLLDISSEDNLTAILLPLIFTLIISKLYYKYLLIGLLVFLLYLTKESMFLVSITISIAIFIFDRRIIDNYKFKYFPLISVLIAILLWGFFGLEKTKRFPFGPSISTWKSFDMSKGLHDSFTKIYPKYSTDILETPEYLEYNLPTNVNNEWDFYDFFKDKNMEKIISKKNLLYKNTLAKIKFIFFNINIDGYTDERIYNLNYVKSVNNFLNRLIFISAILLSFYFLIFANEKRISCYYLLIFFSNMVPHFIGWATAKHLVGATILSIFYLLYIAFKKNFLFKVKSI